MDPDQLASRRYMDPDYNWARVITGSLWGRRFSDESQTISNHQQIFVQQLDRANNK